jgi:hypothetical protein
MAAFDSQDRDLTGPGQPEHLSGEQISSGLLSTLGVKPILGREFSPEEDKHGGAPVVIISQRLWKDRFAKAPRLSESLSLWMEWTTPSSEFFPRIFASSGTMPMFTHRSDRAIH